MKVTGYWQQIILLMVFVLPNEALSQEDTFFTDTPVYATTLSEDKNLLAVADWQTVYILNAKDFALKQTFPYDIKKQGVVSYLDFHPANQNILLIRFSKYNGEFSESKLNLYPEDSIFGYDITTKKKVMAVPGNIRFGLTQTNKNIIAANRYRPYTTIGKSKYYALPGIIYLPSQEKKEAKSVVNDLEVSPQEDLVVISYIDSLAGDGDFRSTLEVRSYPDFGLLKKKESLKGVFEGLEFSDNGKYLFYHDQDWMISIVYAQTLEQPETYDVRSIGQSVLNNTLLSKKDYSIAGINIETGEERWQIWSNLTPLFSISGASFYNENEILVFGPRERGFNVEEQKGAVYKLNLEDDEIYVRSETVFKTDTLFDPQQLLIKSNDWKSENIEVAPDEKYFAGYGSDYGGGNTLELWSYASKKKLQDWIFDEEIYGVNFDAHSENLLVIENYSQKDYSSFRVHNIDLHSGERSTKIYSDNEADFLDPEFNCRTYPVPGKEALWLVSDSRGSLWEIDGKELSVKRLFDFEENTKKYAVDLNTTMFSNQEKIALFPVSYNIKPDYELYDHELDSILIYNLNSGKILRNPSFERLFDLDEKVRLINDSLAIVFDAKGYKLLHPETQQVYQREKWKTNESYKNLLTKDKHLCLITELESEQYKSIRIKLINLTDLQSEHFKIPYGTSIRLLNEELLYVEDDQLTSFSFMEEKPESHSVDTDIYLDDSDLSTDGYGYLMFNKNIIIDLATLKKKTEVPEFYNASLLKGEEAGNLAYLFSDSYSDKPYYQFRISSVDSMDNPSWKSEKFKIRNYTVPVNSTKVSSSGRHVVFYSNSNFSGDGKLFLIDVEKRELTELESKSYSSVKFSSNGKYLLVRHDKESMPVKHATEVFDLQSGEKLFQADVRIDDFDGKKGLSSNMQGVDVIMFNENGELKSKEPFYARQWVGPAVFLEGRDMFAGGSDEGSLFVWSPEKESPLKKLNLGSSEILSIEESGDKLLVLTRDAAIKVLDLDELEEALSINFSQDSDENLDFAFFTPEGYFNADKDMLRDFHFVKGAESYPISSYELFLNRPDIILERLGFAGQELMDLYYKAYEKRLAYFGFDPDAAIENFNMPEVSIANLMDIPEITNEELVEVAFSASADESLLKKLLVEVNGVPVYGSGGKALPPVKQEFSKVEIPLMSGNNKIQLSVLNSQGVESLPVSVEVVSEKTHQEKVYFVGIGVSDYQNDDFDLAYAAKDIRDLTSQLSQRYENLVVDTLIDNAVTRKNILEIKQRLLNTRLEDKVILSMSGHGLLDDNFDFYFATHDVDFDNPSAKGVSYDELEWLLDSIPARKKLFLMDACHSGEVDKEELMAYNSEKEEGMKSGVKKYTYRADILQYDEEVEQGIGLQNSFQLMQEMFTNLNRGSGAVVISAAAGDSYAMESDEWQNGVFTYSLLEGLRYGYADVNGDEKVTVTELRDYVSKSVQDLTNGLQKPTMRQENIEFDFRVW